ncbi:MAG TPA: phosphoenolpyruvate synthase [Candidatus Woesebacteria bacterium]|nr:phosphoenolpyruvate synthase [Candidatus Woesebacteria bacterium]
MPKNILWFKEISLDDIPIVGGKGANLGEMYRSGIPVPNGFVVTTQAYFHFLETNRLVSLIQNILKITNPDDPNSLLEASKKIKTMIKTSPMDPIITKEIIESYRQLARSYNNKKLAVAVRSSATAEDTADASFAGQQETFLNVIGEDKVVRRVRDCWASLFTPRSIFYRFKKHIDHFKIGVAVPIQKLVQSDVSGIIFTINPVTNNKSQIVIEAIFGLGEYIVQGIVTPDQFIVDKTNWSLIQKTHIPQEIKLIKSQQETKEVKIPKKDQNKPKLTDELVLELARISQKLHNYYTKPQDIEFAIEKGKIYIVQTRPITTVINLQKILDNQSRIDQTADLTGEPASPGLATGKIIIINSPKEINRVGQNQILVTTMTTPDFVPAMKKVNGIITDKGGQTSHAAIVSRELGVPCVVGAKIATKFFKEGETVTIDGTTGKIWNGNLIANNTFHLPGKPINFQPNLKTATKIYVNLGEPDLAKEMAQKNCDGIGLLRAEFMIANIGIHPKRIIAEHKEKNYIDKLAKDMVKFCQAFSPRPVIYRATDFKTNEYRFLKYGSLYEPIEPNPLMGFRGASRYITSPDVFMMELEAIKQVRNKYGYKNLWLMIPFVRTPDELFKVKKIIAAAGLLRSPSFKLFMMAEIPSNVIILDKFIDVGIDGISIGSNDLTMLTLGLDRDNAEVANNFNEMDPAVLWSLRHLIKKAHKRKILVGICGQAPSNYPDLVEKLVKWGIDSISVSPDAIDRTREIVAWAEKRKIRQKHP